MTLSSNISGSSALDISLRSSERAFFIFSRAPSKWVKPINLGFFGMNRYFKNRKLGQEILGYNLRIKDDLCTIIFFITEMIRSWDPDCWKLFLLAIFASVSFGEIILTCFEPLLDVGPGKGDSVSLRFERIEGWDPLKLCDPLNFWLPIPRPMKFGLWDLVCPRLGTVIEMGTSVS